MGFFSKKKKGDTAQDYVIPDDDADLPVAHVVQIPKGAPPPAAAMPPTTAPSAPPMQFYTLETKTTTQQQSQHIPNIFLTRFPVEMEHCPCCQVTARTRVVTFPNWVTWSLCVVIFFLCWPVCWIPLVMTKVNADLLACRRLCLLLPMHCNNRRSNINIYFF